MSEQTVTIEADLIDESDMAIWIRSANTGEIASVPRSKTTDNGDGTFTMPEWIAMEKELI